LEKWKLEQIGPQRLRNQLNIEAPRLAKILPEFPRLVHAFLQRDHEHERKQLLALLQAQRKTNQTLQTILLLALGFFAGIVITAVMSVLSLAG
jgi:ubiquinone biosynthesis protein